MNWGKLIFYFLIFQSIAQIVSYLGFKKLLKSGFEVGAYETYENLVFAEMKRRDPSLSDEDCFNRFVFAYPPDIFWLFVPFLGMGIVGFLKMFALQGSNPEQQEKLSKMYIERILN